MIISLDTETTGVDLAHGAMPFLVTTCADDGKIRYWEWHVDPVTRQPQIPDEEWSDVEIALYRKVKCLTLENIAMIARYYKSERAKGSEGIHRRDFTTFLRNCSGELDRARAFASRKVSHKFEQGTSDTSRLTVIPFLSKSEIEEGERFAKEMKARYSK